LGESLTLKYGDEAFLEIEPRAVEFPVGRPMAWACGAISICWTPKAV